MQKFILVSIKFYQKNISPRLQMVFGPSLGCRYYPTCSDYARQAIRDQGLVNGGIKVFLRLGRCNPLFKGGVDFLN